MTMWSMTVNRGTVESSIILVASYTRRRACRSTNQKLKSLPIPYGLAIVSVADSEWRGAIMRATVEGGAGRRAWSEYKSYLSDG